jgi:hypothetical protein
MSERDDWVAKVAGDGCPLCAPRPESNDHWDYIATLSASTLYLAKNQTYRGQCQLTFDLRHAARLDQLSSEEYALFSADLYLAQHAVARVVAADHVNVESLGNVRAAPALAHRAALTSTTGAGACRCGPHRSADMPFHTGSDDSDRDSLIEAIRAALREASIAEGLT